jgi:ribonuclease P protein component
MKSTAQARRSATGSPEERSTAAHARPLRESNEKNLSTEQPTTETHARLSQPHGHAGRASGAQTPARQGSQAADGQHSTEATGLTRAPEHSAADQRLPRTRRIRKRSEFLELQRVGRRWAGSLFVVITDRVRTGTSRLGITASRKVGGAVVRNRVKRLVREVFRRYRDRMNPPRRVVVIARPAAAAATRADVERELSAALEIDGRN